MEVAEEWDIALVSHLSGELHICSTDTQEVTNSGEFKKNIFYFTLSFSLLCCLNRDGWKSITKPAALTSNTWHRIMSD